MSLIGVLIKKKKKEYKALYSERSHYESKTTRHEADSGMVGNKDLEELCMKENQVACQLEALKQEIKNSFKKDIQACIITVHNRSLTEAKQLDALALNVYMNAFWTFIKQ